MEVKRETVPLGSCLKYTHAFGGYFFPDSVACNDGDPI